MGEPRVDIKTGKHSEQLQNTIAVMRQQVVENIEVIDTKIIKKEIKQKET